jgi:hypothetical protein
MPGKVTIAVEGAKQIEAALKALGPIAAGRVARSALTRGATPVVQQARALVPVATGLLRASFGR